MKDVKILKLSTGEEIICEFIGMSENKIGKCVQVKKPFGIAPVNGSIGVFPWCVASIKPNDAVYEIHASNVVMMHEPPQEMINSYIEQTSGIAVPTGADKSLILG